jgi:hypothetical protein
MRLSGESLRNNAINRQFIAFRAAFGTIRRLRAAPPSARSGVCPLAAG